MSPASTAFFASSPAPGKQQYNLEILNYELISLSKSCQKLVLPREKQQFNMGLKCLVSPQQENVTVNSTVTQNNVKRYI